VRPFCDGMAPRDDNGRISRSLEYSRRFVWTPKGTAYEDGRSPIHARFWLELPTRLGPLWLQGEELQVNGVSHQFVA
jgi:hypothetical protein